MRCLSKFLDLLVTMSTCFFVVFPFFCFRYVLLMDDRPREKLLSCRYLVDPFIHQWRGYDDPANLQDNEHQMVFEDRVIIMDSWMRWPHFQKLHQIETSRNFEFYGMFPLPNVVKMFGKVLETINPTCITMFIPRSQCRFSTILTAFFRIYAIVLSLLRGAMFSCPKRKSSTVCFFLGYKEMMKNRWDMYMSMLNLHFLFIHIDQFANMNVFFLLVLSLSSKLKNPWMDLSEWKSGNCFTKDQMLKWISFRNRMGRYICTIYIHMNT